MRETLLLFIVLTEYCSSSCLFCPVLSSCTKTIYVTRSITRDIIAVHIVI